VQESLRHANSKITLDLYAQAVMPTKRKAQSKVVRMLLPAQIGVQNEGSGSEAFLTNPFKPSTPEPETAKLLGNMVARDGVEPPTPAFSVCEFRVATTT
jgi:hypothetical protein